VFPTADAVGAGVIALLAADVTTGTVNWQHGYVLEDDPLADPSTQDVLAGYVMVHDATLTPWAMGGTSTGTPSGRNLSAWEGLLPVQVTFISRDPAQDTSAAAVAAENMMTQVHRVLVAGDQTLGGLVSQIVELTTRLDGIPKNGVAWATTLLRYRFIASP